MIDLEKLIRRTLSDPGKVTPRDFGDRGDDYEPLHHWQARALLAAVVPLDRAAHAERIAAAIENNEPWLKASKSLVIRNAAAIARGTA